MRNSCILGPGTLLLLLAACSTPRERELAALHELDRRHAEALSAFRVEQASFAEQSDTPTAVEASLGTLFVDNCELLGRPGKAFLHAEFTYVNTTHREVGPLRVVLTISDPASGRQASSWVDLDMPFALSVTPESSYTSWLDADTEGLHSYPGWEWNLRLERR